MPDELFFQWLGTLDGLTGVLLTADDSVRRIIERKTREGKVNLLA